MIGAFILALALLLPVQQPNSDGSGTCGALSAAGVCTVQNTGGVIHASFETVPAGSPTSVSVTVQGCMRGGTCDTASATITSTTPLITYVTFAKAYDSFQVTVGTLSGGTSPTVTVNYRLGAN